MLLLASCASRDVRDGPQSASTSSRNLPADAVPKKEPRSRYGNPSVYKELGHWYTVMESSYGYQERGVASWYGKKFHGRPTSSQEPYDMYAMTAAHKTLPLPTYVRVRNLRNNKSVVVKVNDRGPFIDNRIIDLSYSAAAKLDMIRDGTGMVEVTALSFDDPPQTRPNNAPVRAQTSAAAPPNNANARAQVTANSTTPRSQVPGDEPPAHAQSAAAPQEIDVFVQVGAFGDVNNAKRRFALLTENGIDEAFVHKDASHSPALYRIRIGPITNVNQYDTLVSRLESIGITETHLITE